MEKNFEPIKLFVPSFDIKTALMEIKECLEVGWTGAGFKTDLVEKKWKEIFGYSNSLFLNSASAGLEIALAGLKKINNWNDDDEIITTPLTFVSTNHAILRANLKPVFCDIDATLCLDPKSVKSRINSRTKGLMYVGIGGSLGNYKEIEEICINSGIKLVIDAAHMAGSDSSDYVNGTNADAIIHSFQAVKNLPSADAGMLSTPIDELHSFAKKMSWLGINLNTYERNLKNKGYKWEYDVEELGYKYNGNSIMASIVLAQIPLLEKDNERRRGIIKQYLAELPKNSIIADIDRSGHYQTSGHLMQIMVKKGLRNSLMDFLANNKIDTGVHYRLNTHYPMYSYSYGTTPAAESIEKEIISLPLHLKLSESDVTRVCKKIEEFCESSVA